MWSPLPDSGADAINISGLLNYVFNLIKKTRCGIPILQKFPTFFQSFESYFFPNFSKTSKNDVQLEYLNSRKILSDLKTNSKAQVQVRNAGPYLNPKKLGI